jgi:hypothetical protein
MMMMMMFTWLWERSTRVRLERVDQPVGNTDNMFCLQSAEGERVSDVCVCICCVCVCVCFVACVVCVWCVCVCYLILSKR